MRQHATTMSFIASELLIGLNVFAPADFLASVTEQLYTMGNWVDDASGNQYVLHFITILRWLSTHDAWILVAAQDDPQRWAHSRSSTLCPSTCRALTRSLRLYHSGARCDL